MQALYPYAVTKLDFSDFGRSFRRYISETNSVTPQIFYIFVIRNPWSQTGKGFRKKSILEDFRANVLNCTGRICFPPCRIFLILGMHHST